MKKRTEIVYASILVVGMSGAAQAALYDRGNGMLYDSDQDLTWLQDANYALTSGYDSDGRMNWHGATTWAGTLNYGGYDDWRLPTVNDNGLGYSFGGTVGGHNTDTSLSEMAYMFHDILGNESFYNTDVARNETGCPNSGLGCLQSTSADGVDIQNLESDVYWSGTEYAPGTYAAWRFDTGYGVQNYSIKDREFSAWAVRSGDVSAVPVPAAVWLFGSGLIGLLGLVRRKR